MDEVRGFQDVESLLKSVSNDIVIVKEVNGETLLIPPSLEGEDRDALPEITWDEVWKTIPPNACGPEDKCPDFILPSSIRFGEYLVVRVAEIYNPSKFWINLVSGNHAENLENLMDDMQVFYAENANKYKAPLQWKPGHHCAAMYKGEWHRAEIYKVIDEERLKVKYFDYGTVDFIQKSELRLLDKQFSDLPKQAIKAKLSAIKPAKGAKTFPLKVNEAFFDLVAYKKLVGSVGEIHHKVPFVALALVDTRGGEDVHINDVLVEMGLAEFTSEDSGNEWTDESTADEGAANNKNESLPTPNIKELAIKTEPRSDSPASSNTTAASPGLTMSSSTMISSPSTLTTPFSHPPKITRPPPGFQEINPSRPPCPAPPGMPNLQGGNMYYAANNNLRPSPPPGISAGIPAGAPPMRDVPPGIQPLITAPLLNPGFYNRQTFNQVPLNPSQLNPLTNPLLLQLLALRPPHAPWQQWPMGALPRNQYPQYQLPVVNNAAFQAKPQPTQYYSQNNANVISPTFLPTSTSGSIKKTDNTASAFEETVIDTKTNVRAWVGTPKNSEELKLASSADDSSSLSKSLPFVESSSCTGGKTLKTSSPPSAPALSPATPLPTPPILLTEAVKNTLRSGSGTNSPEPDLPRTNTVCTGPTRENSAKASAKSVTSVQSTSTSLNRTTPGQSVPNKDSNKPNPSKPSRSTKPAPKIVWQPLDVSLGIVHLLNYQKEAFVSSDELAKTCLSLSGHSALAQILEAKRCPVPVQELRREDHPEFFASLDRCPDWSKNSDNSVKLDLIPLKNVVTAVISAGIKQPKVVFAFQAARREFDPEAEYWKQTC